MTPRTNRRETHDNNLQIPFTPHPRWSLPLRIPEHKHRMIQRARLHQTQRLGLGVPLQPHYIACLNPLSHFSHCIPVRKRRGEDLSMVLHRKRGVRFVSISAASRVRASRHVPRRSRAESENMGATTHIRARGAVLLEDIWGMAWGGGAGWCRAGGYMRSEGGSLSVRWLDWTTPQGPQVWERCDGGGLGVSAIFGMDGAVLEMVMGLTCWN